jgi:hypothetical protein
MDIRHSPSCSESTGLPDALSCTPVLVLHHVNQRFAAKLGSVRLSLFTSCGSLNILRYAILVGQNDFMFLLAYPGDSTIHHGSFLQGALSVPLAHKPKQQHS